jgi:hypothetical protein
MSLVEKQVAGPPPVSGTSAGTFPLACLCSHGRGKIAARKCELQSVRCQVFLALTLHLPAT